MQRPHWFGRRRALEEDLQDEIRSHLAMAVGDRIEGGQDPEAARSAALKDFGNVMLAREATTAHKPICCRWSC